MFSEIEHPEDDKIYNDNVTKSPSPPLAFPTTGKNNLVLIPHGKGIVTIGAKLKHAEDKKKEATKTTQDLLFEKFDVDRNLITQTLFHPHKLTHVRKIGEGSFARVILVHDEIEDKHMVS